MKELEEKCLRFVLLHYKQNKLDTLKALRTFKRKHHILEPHRKYSWYAWAVSGVAAAFFLGLVLKKYLYPDAKWTEITAYEHPVNYLLPDSSAVMLFPHSSVRYCCQDYLSDRRDVHLRGKVSFVVRHDASRPFTASGQLSEVRVLGTRFLIDESKTDTSYVQVESGRVRLQAVGQYQDAIILSEGMSAQVVRGQHSPQIVRKSGQARKGSFVFNNTPLQKVLDELSKYYGVRLTADNTDKRLTADFNTRSLDEIIEIIEKVLSVKIKKGK